MAVSHKGNCVKKELNQYRMVKWMIKDMESQIADIEERISSIQGRNITGMPRGGKPITKEELVIDKIDLISRKERFEKIAKLKREIVQAYIDTVISVRHNRLLTFHYIKCMTIHEIAKAEHYSKRHAFRIFEEAIEMVDLSIT